MALSYTQNLEDYHLSLAFAGQERGFYIDIGAGHPVADNVSLWFYERGWNGIVAEPIPELANLYKKIRERDTVYQGLIGREVGTVDFFHVNRGPGIPVTAIACARHPGEIWHQFPACNFTAHRHDFAHGEPHAVFMQGSQGAHQVIR